MERLRKQMRHLTFFILLEYYLIYSGSYVHGLAQNYLVIER